MLRSPLSALPTGETFLASLPGRLADTVRLAANARKRCEDNMANPAGHICEEWRRMMESGH
ncbi:MAG TPA: hypothetical protein VL336_06405 [Sphingomicrobium sp.]|jgi:hypothetical protein|nr:hypothetical protein [Sphingomicrobium sp.]